MSLKDIFNSDKRKLKKVEKQIKPIIALEDKYKKMTDEELRNQTTILKAELAKGKKLNDILVPAFATAREACRRVRGEFPYPTQLEGAVILPYIWKLLPERAFIWLPSTNTWPDVTGNQWAKCINSLV